MQERGSLDTGTGTVSFVAVIFIASPNFLTANFAKLGTNHKNGTVLRVKRAGQGLLQNIHAEMKFIIFIAKCLKWNMSRLPFSCIAKANRLSI